MKVQLRNQTLNRSFARFLAPNLVSPLRAPEFQSEPCSSKQTAVMDLAIAHSNHSGPGNHWNVQDAHGKLGTKDLSIFNVNCWFLFLVRRHNRDYRLPKNYFTSDTELIRIYDLPKEIAEDVGELRKALRQKFELRSRIVFCESLPYDSIWPTYWYNFEDMKRYSNVHFYVTKQKWYASHIYVKNYKLEICVPRLWPKCSNNPRRKFRKILKDGTTQTHETTILSRKFTPVYYSNPWHSSFMNKKMPVVKNKTTQTSETTTTQQYERNWTYCNLIWLPFS